jgi:hypothetical protein
MSNSTVDFYVSVGVRALQEINRESALNTTFNPECTEYRKSVFPGLSSFMRDVFAAERFRTITYNERISILSEVKDEAISKIVSLRNQSVVAKVTEVKVNPIKVCRNIEAELYKTEVELNEMNDLANKALDIADKYLAEIAELKAELVTVKSENFSLRTALRLNVKGVVTSLTKAVCSIKQSV